jgi:hypothetical protein
MSGNSAGANLAGVKRISRALILSRERRLGATEGGDDGSVPRRTGTPPGVPVPSLVLSGGELVDMQNVPTVAT